MIATQNLPFQITLACNPYESGQALFQEFAPDACIFSSGNDLLNHIHLLSQTLVISSYLINSYWFCTNQCHHVFLEAATVNHCTALPNTFSFDYCSRGHS
jgi:hypothetical protein